MFILSLVLFLVAALLHISIHTIIYKAHLKDKQYYLIQISSIIDALFALNCFLFVINKVFEVEPPEQLLVTISTTLYLFHYLSLNIMTLIALDRIIAVKYCLRYHTLVTKSKLNSTILVCCITNFGILCCFYFLSGYENFSQSMVIYTGKGVPIFTTTIRASTCLTIIVLGRMTIHLRDESEKALKKLTNIHGVKAEKLNRFKIMKRSIKDVIKLNFCACIFLFPATMASFCLSMDIVPNLAFRINCFLYAIYIFSNPLLYLICFTKIRQYWYRKSSHIVLQIHLLNLLKLSS